MNNKLMKRIIAGILSFSLIISFLSVSAISRADEDPDKSNTDTHYPTLYEVDDLIEEEKVTADDLNISLSDGFDPETIDSSIHYDPSYVSVSYLPEESDYIENEVGLYTTSYLCSLNGRDISYLISRRINVYNDSDDEDSETKDSILADDRKIEELPLSAGEITTLQTADARFVIALDKDNTLKSGEPLESDEILKATENKDDNKNILT